MRLPFPNGRQQVGEIVPINRSRVQAPLRILKAPPIPHAHRFNITTPVTATIAPKIESRLG